MDNRTMKILSIIGLMALFLLPTYYYTLLPDTVPMHFGFSGLPDDYGNKLTIWLLPIIGLVIYFGMHIIGNRVENEIKESEENSFQKLKKDKISVEMLWTLNCFMMWLFAYIVYCIIQVALGNQSGLGRYFIFVFIISLFGIIAYYMINMQRASKE